MLLKQGEKNNHSELMLAVLMVSVVSLAFSIRFLNSISSILLVLIVFVSSQRSILIKKAFSNPYFLCLLALFLLQVCGLLYAEDTAHGWKEVTKKAGLVAIPFFFCAIRDIPARVIYLVMISFTISLALVCLYCLIHAAILYSEHHDSSVFFYHKLVLPFRHHAVFFSFFLFYCMVYWVEEGRLHIRSKYVLFIAMIFFFSGMIILLSSKLVIGLSLAYLLVFVLRNLNKRTTSRLVIAGIIVIVTSISVVSFTHNPVRERFADIGYSNDTLLTQKKFATETYFNGLEFRLLTWRFTYEIMDRRKAWVLGVSPGDAQHALNDKYKEVNMYMGEDGEHGFWNFNCHNLYLQTVLESGIVGFFLLCAAIVLLLIDIVKRKKWTALIFFIAILAFSFVESLLSTQYALLLFLFFPLLSLCAKRVELPSQKAQ